MILPSHTSTEPIGMPPSARPFLASSIAAWRNASMTSINVCNQDKVPSVNHPHSSRPGESPGSLLIRNGFYPVVAMAAMSFCLVGKAKRRSIAGPPFTFQNSITRSFSQPFLDDVFQQIANAVAVAPFVVIPTHQLEEAFVELDARTLVEDGREGAMYEVAAHHFVIGVIQDAFEVGLAGLFHGRGDFLVAGVLRGPDGQVHDGNRRHRDAKGHARELALDLRANQAHGLGGAGRAGDHVLRRSAAAFPILLAGPVHRLL